MFALTEMKDTVRIPPWKFYMKLNKAIAEELNRKFANKVVLNIGLCIALFDITKLEDSYILPGDGASHTKDSSETEQVWIWEYEVEDEKHELFMDPGEEIRFRIRDEVFVDTTPAGPETSETTAGRPEDKKVPYTLIGSICEPGLGLLSWWNN